MHRWGRVAAWSLGLLLGLPVLLLAALLILGNIDPGRRVIAALMPRLTGGTIALHELGGRFPDRLRAGHAELSDATGVYATIDGLAVDWRPLRLLGGAASLDRLAASRIALARLPESSGSAASSELPVRVDIDRIEIERLDLPAALAGTDAALKVSGSAHVTTLDAAKADLVAERSDAAGRYQISATIDAAGLAAHIAAEEPGQGLLAGLAGLPELGALSLAADLAGPRSAERVSLQAKAGPLTASGAGTIDLVGGAIDLDLSAAAPEMAPAPTIAWQSAALEAHVHGSFVAPDVQGRLAVAGLRVGDGAAERVSFDVTGSGGKVDLTGTVASLRLPGPHPDLLAAVPVQITAEADLKDPGRPVHLTVSHPLLAAELQADTSPAVSGTVVARIADLGPLAAPAGLALEGAATISAALAERDAATIVSLDGTIAITGGEPIAVQMIGADGHFSLAARLAGDDIFLDRFSLAGKRGSTEMSGSARQGLTDLDWRLSLVDVAPLAPGLVGSVAAHGKLSGSIGDLALSAEADGDLATPGFARSPLHVVLTAQGLPAAPKGRVTAQGTLDRAPVQLAVAVARDEDGTTHLTIDRADWRSARASGDVTIPAGTMLPIGTLRLRVGTLADLEPFLGAHATGSLDAALDWLQAGSRPQARLRAGANNVAFGGTSIQRLALDGTIDDPTGRQVTALHLTAEGIDGNGLSGSAEIEANGPATAIALRLAARLQQAGKPAAIAANGQLSVPRRELVLTALTGSYAGQDARLLAPSRVTFANGIAVDRLRLAVARTTLDVAGRLSPTLALTVSAHDVALELARPFLPDLPMQGTLSAEARIGGSLTAPEGTIRLDGSGLKIASGAGRAMPPASIQVNARLGGGAVRLDAKLAAGNRAQLTLTGQAPLESDLPLDLHSRGTIDLALLAPVLAANGRTLLGRLSLDLAVVGPRAAPRVAGTAQIANGEFQDYAQGVHISAITALLQADGDTLRLQRLTGRAGSGSITASGTIGILAPGIPVAIDIQAENARPLQSDLITATLGGQLTLRGRATEQLALAGRLAVSRAEITIPDSFPPTVAKLDVHIPGRQVQSPTAANSFALALDLAIDAPQQIFVRGHGLDAEMGGSLRARGALYAPEISGGFDLRHGTLSLAGQTLTFTSGKVSFTGSGLTSKLDPALNFVAQTNSGGVTATLTLSGYADQPKIALTSLPELPQDEVLAHLLYGQSVKQLGPLQLAEIAEALASLGGAGIGNPLAAVRKKLGLDRLNLSSDAAGTGGMVEAGKYVANGVYVGAKQGTAGGTQAQVQIDLTKHLKLETTIGTGSAPATGATPQNDPGSSIGLTYQFEY